MLLTDDHERVRLLTLDRPDALNAFNDDLYDAVRDALRDASAEPAVAACVLTGSGRAFSSGQDLRDMTRPRTREDLEQRGFDPFVSALQAFDKPLVAAVNGLAVGVGVTMLLHCDVVFAAESAKFRLPFVALGIVPEAGSSRLLVDRVGWQCAADMLYRAEWLGASDAQRRGFVWELTTPDALLPAAMAYAQQIARMPVASLKATKRLLLEARGAAVSAARQAENSALTELVGAPANLEAVAAFLEGRVPDFTKLPPD